MKTLMSFVLALIFLVFSSLTSPVQAQVEPGSDVMSLPHYPGRGNLTNDVLYYIQVDRFADGNTENNIPLSAFPVDETLPESTRTYNEANRVLLPYLHDPTHRYINLYWGGDLAGITQKLDYLKALGVTKLVLSPIQDAANGLIYNPGQNGYLHDRISPEDEHYNLFYARASAGFNQSWTKDWWDIDEHLVDGNLADRSDRFQSLATLLNEAKKREIGIILEVNLNHTSPYRGFDPYPNFDPAQYQQWLVDQGAVYKSGALVAEYVDSKTGENNPQNWFHTHQNIDYNRPTPEALEQGSTGGLPDLNHQNPEVYDYLLKAMQFWLEFNQAEAPIAGLYLPAIANVPLNFWQDLEAIVGEVNPQAILIADYGDGGYRNEKSMEWYRDTQNFALVNYSLSIAARRFFGDDRGWDGRTIVLREHTLGKEGDHYNPSLPQKFFNFMLNPSQSLEIPQSSLDRVRQEDALAWVNFLEAGHQTRLLTYYPKMSETAYSSAIKFLFLSPGVPLLFYGVETGLAVPYHIDHRSPFGAGGDPFNEPMMIWPNDSGWNESLHSLTQKLGTLRQDYPLLRYGQTQFLFPPGSHADKDLFMVRTSGSSDRCLEEHLADQRSEACTAILYAYSSEGGDFSIDLKDFIELFKLDNLSDLTDSLIPVENLESQQTLVSPNSGLAIHLEPEASQVFILSFGQRLSSRETSERIGEVTGIPVG